VTVTSVVTTLTSGKRPENGKALNNITLHEIGKITSSLIPQMERLDTSGKSDFYLMLLNVT
jgi:hypothetical protein